MGWVSGPQPESHPGQMAGIHMSLDLYMSDRSLVMGTLPIVFLKNTSSMVEGLTERREGRSRRSFPKRQGCVGYLKDISQGSTAHLVQKKKPKKKLVLRNEAAPVRNYRAPSVKVCCLINFLMNLSQCSQLELVQNNWGNKHNEGWWTDSFHPYLVWM